MECTDKKCNTHGSLRVHGRRFVGTVTEAKAQHTASVQWERQKHIAKYERYERRRTKVKAHNPPCIDAKKGDKVTICECKPLSKTKHFVILEKLGTNQEFMHKQEHKDVVQRAKVEEKKTQEQQA